MKPVEKSRTLFVQLHDRMEEKISKGLDQKKLGWSLTLMLKEIIEDINDKEKMNESNDKLEQIDIELGEIAENVKKNISDIFERGEKFNNLVCKSEALKTQVYIFMIWQLSISIVQNNKN